MRLLPGLSPLRHRDFALYWVGQCVSQIGTFIEMTATAYLLYAPPGRAAAISADERVGLAKDPLPAITGAIGPLVVDGEHGQVVGAGALSGVRRVDEHGQALANPHVRGPEIPMDEVVARQPQPARGVKAAYQPRGEVGGVGAYMQPGDLGRGILIEDDR
jgi:hypothetical protein